MLARILTTIVTLFTAFPVLADGSIIPKEAVILFIILIILGGLGISMLLAFFVKLILQKIRNEKRNKIWIMSLTIFLTTLLYLYCEDEYDWLYYSNVEINYGYETRVKLYYSLITLSALLGSILGYFLTPKKK